MSFAETSAARDFERYCFANNPNKMNMFEFAGNGFYAYPVGRRGNSLYYQRVGRTSRYVGETGAIYTFRGNGRVTWSDGHRIIRLRGC
ncbi:MAG: hypothetical protein AAGL24_19465 [Pseudomonadota bacterium]